MASIIIAPNKYIQGQGELANIGTYTKPLGEYAFVILSKSGYQRVGATVEASFQAAGCRVHFEYFNGECSKNEIQRLKTRFDELGCTVCVGIGGGKIHDTSKALAYYAHKPVVIVPTIAGTDAPCSALSVIYTDDGVFEEYLWLPANPNVVLVDTEVISKAPARLLVSGMGDALATYFEAKATADSNSSTCAGGKITNAALVLARACYDTLLADGLKAKLAVENHVCTKAVENIIEANTYLSGIGFESGGLAGAHAIHNGFTVAPATHNLYHGEKVAFGTLVQLVLQNADMEQIEEVLDFCCSVGLPTTLAQLGITEVKEEEIMAIAQAACAPGETIHNMPMEVTAEKVYAAILAADALGRLYQ
ncbi:glycerol dehydrogenase [Flavonifractor sp. An100]|uniref:glycerol dehydrogenase n=1 Tax=Flavonifractor sp. An100 TaxID=1965538 RepID=UPI000B36C6EE|nr:glycerol dehydrogenase [Flavonifractor sp. An100]OUQ80255.1 glycerol dehydrogenase [Flavonifractor sp. An100]